MFDQRAIAQCFLARILWLQGSGDQAVSLTKEIVETAVAGDDGLSLCQTLVQGACPVALFVGDLEALEHYVSMLLDYSERQALDFWQAFGRCFQSVLYIRRGHLAEGLARLAEALDGLREIQFGVYYGVFLSEFADALARVGRAEEGRRTIDEALARAERNEERWYKPELLRIKGEIVLRQGLPNALGRSREILPGVARLVPTPGDDRVATACRDKPRETLPAGEPHRRGPRNTRTCLRELQRRPGDGGSEGGEGRCSTCLPPEARGARRLPTTMS